MPLGSFLLPPDIIATGLANLDGLSRTGKTTDDFVAPQKQSVPSTCFTLTV